MTMLKYKTRAMSDPQGKPKVFFCCEPDDFSQYFGPVSNQILEKCNCTIWYHPSEEREYGSELLYELSCMQLFVMPVTTNLLCGTGSTLSTEFTFAIEHHIPILPIIQENNINELFQQKCNGLQYLNCIDRNSHGESFSEKLEKYLSKVLLNDSLSEEVRKIFRARLFLSYRREDKQCVQSLIRDIHKNDSYCDVGIWYDEYLVPGENFRKAIYKAIAECDVFLMAITPNVISEHNFVKDEEYPLAAKLNKPILPVELVPTSQTELCTSFHSIPPCIVGEDREQLILALNSLLIKLGANRTFLSPEHKYLLGLAYLYGIEVEVDGKRANQMLSEAATSGIYDAAKKLSEMYRFGIGVERSIDTAIYWMRYMIELQMAEYIADPDYPKLDALFWECMQCGNFYLECDNYDGAYEQYSQGLSYITSISDFKDVPYLMRNIWAGNTMLAQLFLRKGEHVKAKEKYLECLQNAIIAASHNNSHEIRRDLALTLAQIGRCYLDNGDLEQAKTNYLKARKINTELAEETYSWENVRDLAASYQDLSYISYAEGNLTQARIHLESMKDITLSLSEESRELTDRRDLVLAYNEIAAICIEQGDLRAARDAAKNSLSLGIKIAKDTGISYDQINISISYDRLGDIYLQESALDKAMYYFRKSFALCASVYNTTHTIASQSALAVCYDNLGDIWHAKGRTKQAYGCRKKSLGIRYQLAKTINTIESIRNLSVSYDRMGEICMAQGKMSKADEYYSKSLTLRRDLNVKVSSSQSKLDLATGCDNLGIARQSLG